MYNEFVPLLLGICTHVYPKMYFKGTYWKFDPWRTKMYLHCHFISESVYTAGTCCRILLSSGAWHLPLLFNGRSSSWSVQARLRRIAHHVQLKAGVYGLGRPHFVFQKQKTGVGGRRNPNIPDGPWKSRVQEKEDVSPSSGITGRPAAVCFGISLSSRARLAERRRQFCV